MNLAPFIIGDKVGDLTS